MSTDYFLDPSPTEAELLAGLPAGVEARLGGLSDSHYETDTRDNGRIQVHRFPLRGPDDDGGVAFIMVYVMDGRVHSLTRYGQNHVGAILDSLAKALKVTIRDELGAVLGRDDWFST